MGSLTCAHVWVRAIHMKGIRQRHVCTRVDSERQKNSCSPCPVRGSNPGSFDLNSDALPTALFPPSNHLYKHCFSSVTLVSASCFRLSSIESIRMLRFDLFVCLKLNIPNFVTSDSWCYIAINGWCSNWWSVVQVCLCFRWLFVFEVKNYSILWPMTPGGVLLLFVVCVLTDEVLFKFLFVFQVTVCVWS